MPAPRRLTRGWLGRQEIPNETLVVAGRRPTKTVSPVDRITWPALTFPIAVLDLVLVTVGVSLLLAPFQVRYHDVGYLWGIVVQIGFWLTPIIYHDTLVPTRWRWLVEFNPLARIITHSREALIYGTWTSVSVLAETTVFAAGVMLVGLLVFRRQQLRLLEHF